MALRIPKAFANAAHLENDTDVDISLVDGKLVVSALRPSRLTLDNLLAGVTDENIHQEIDTGPSVGNEAW